MKLIVAMIKPHKLADVKAALLDVGIKKLTVTNVLGQGQQAGKKEAYRGVVSEINLLKKIRLEIAVNDNCVKKTKDAIISGARTGEGGKGEIGDGKIFELDLPGVTRIRTGEEGEEAIGQ